VSQTQSLSTSLSLTCVLIDSEIQDQLVNDSEILRQSLCHWQCMC